MKEFYWKKRENLIACFNDILEFFSMRELEKVYLIKNFFKFFWIFNEINEEND